VIREILKKPIGGFGLIGDKNTIIGVGTKYLLKEIVLYCGFVNNKPLIVEWHRKPGHPILAGCCW